VLASPAVTAPNRLAEAVAALRARPAESAVLCDVDGTLAPIVARPEDAALLPGARETLEALRGRYRLVGFISGRGLADLERIVGLPGCAYAGNHGMELHAPGEAPRLAAEVEPHLPAVRAFAERFGPERLAPWGVSLEDKGATLSLHYRRAPDPEAARAALEREVVPAARAAGLSTHGGRMVLEVRPKAPVDKGTAARALLEGTGARAALYVGDDRTDADAWRALRELAREGRLDRAAAVVVSSPELDPRVGAQADAAVAGPEGALAMLRALAG
jgi:trehalose 6-phosphate phosphatase